MAVDRVPWAVSTEGVDHPASQARIANFISTGPKRGIVPAGSASGQTWQTNPPSGSVRVAPMVAVTPNTYPGHFGEAYVLRNISQTEVPIRATGSGGGRSDVIVFRVDDPALGGGTVSDVTTYDFARFQVVEGVPTSVVNATQLAYEKNLNFPFVWVSRINLPANTATVTTAMIDQSGRVQIGGQTETATIVRGGDLGYHWLNSKDPAGQRFPASGGMHTVYIPEWATRMRVRFEWINIEYMGTENSYGDMWIEYDGIRTNRFHFDTSGLTNRITANWTIADDVLIPANLRGTRVPFHAMAVLGGNAATGQVRTIAYSGTILEVDFRETLL